MSDQPKVGDVSHLVDELPPARVVQDAVPVVVTEGDHAHTAEPGAKQAVVQALIEHVASGQEQAEGLKLLKEPCTACEHFYFPMPDSQEYRWVVGMIKAKLANLPGWQRETLTGRDPDEWGVCRRLNACVHMTNTFECYEARKGTIGIGRAKDRREA